MTQPTWKTIDDLKGEVAREGAGNVSDEQFKLCVKMACELSRYGVSIADLRKALTHAGLALVPAADVPTPEERAVLAEAYDAVDRWMQDEDGGDCMNRVALKVQNARREAPPRLD